MDTARPGRDRRGDAVALALGGTSSTSPHSPSRVCTGLAELVPPSVPPDLAAAACANPFPPAYTPRMNSGLAAINAEVQRAASFVGPLFNELNKIIVGQKYLTERLVVGLLANG